MAPVHKYIAVLCSLVLTLSGCASTDSLLQRPTVDLTSVEFGEMSIARQTFLLGINVYNPKEPVKVCHWIFNPINHKKLKHCFVVDEKQPDRDGDGIGDACEQRH